MDEAQRRRQVRTALLASTAAVAAAATDGAYLALIHSQVANPPQNSVVPFVSGYIAVIAGAALIGMGSALLGRMATARTVLLSAAAGSAALGFLAIFSIGLALFITAALLAVAARSIPAVTEPRAWVWPVSGSLVAIVALIAGFFLVGTF